MLRSWLPLHLNGNPISQHKSQRRTPANGVSTSLLHPPLPPLQPQALAGGIESGESSATEDSITPTSEQAGQRFEHYKLTKGEDGKPVKLGRVRWGSLTKTDAYNGDIHCHSEVLRHLAHDIRQGVRARTVMESDQSWLGEGPELAVLRMLGLFDRPRCSNLALGKCSD
jgi:hypothetical protein